MGDAGTGKSCLIKRYCEDKVQQHSALARPNNDLPLEPLDPPPPSVRVEIHIDYRGGLWR